MGTAFAYMEAVHQNTIMQANEPGAGTPPLALAGNHAGHHFNYQGWDVTLQLDGVSREGHVSGHADLRAGNYSCRLVLATPHGDGASALRALAQRARTLIADREALAASIKRSGGDTNPA